MAFAPGDHVHLAHLGKGIVREARSGGRYLVEIKGRSILVSAHQLTAVEGKRRPPGGGEHAPASVPETLTRPHTASIDLHGMTAIEAVVALDTFLSDALLAGLPEVRVIHGRRGGRLKAAVHQHLRAVSAVRNVRLDGGNPGVTIVTL